LVQMILTNARSGAHPFPFFYIHCFVTATKRENSLSRKILFLEMEITNNMLQHFSTNQK